MIVYGLLSLASFLIGGIPFGYLIVRVRKGIDLRTIGSGNLGATNAARILGAKWFAIVFFLDFLKGFVPAFVVSRIAVVYLDAPTDIGLLYGLLAVAGHVWPIYLKFRGGKGVATASGVVLGIAPAATGVTAVVFLVVLVVWRYVSLGSIVAAVTLPLVYAVLNGADGRTSIQITLVVLGVLVIWKHRSNLGRIRRGTESRVGKSRSGEEVESA